MCEEARPDMGHWGRPSCAYPANNAFNAFSECWLEAAASRKHEGWGPHQIIFRFPTTLGEAGTQPPWPGPVLLEDTGAVREWGPSCVPPHPPRFHHHSRRWTFMLSWKRGAGSSWLPNAGLHNQVIVGKTPKTNLKKSPRPWATAHTL